MITRRILIRDRKTESVMQNTRPDQNTDRKLYRENSTENRASRKGDETTNRKGETQQPVSR